MWYCICSNNVILLSHFMQPFFQKSNKNASYINLAAHVVIHCYNCLKTLSWKTIEVLVYSQRLWPSNGDYIWNEFMKWIEKNHFQYYYIYLFFEFNIMDTTLSSLVSTIYVRQSCDTNWHTCEDVATVYAYCTLNSIVQTFVFHCTFIEPYFTLFVHFLFLPNLRYIYYAAKRKIYIKWKPIFF